MTNREIAKILGSMKTNGSHEAVAVGLAIEALNGIDSGRYIKGDCQKCSKVYGSFGCCSTVNNEWKYSCREGMREYIDIV